VRVEERRRDAHAIDEAAAQRERATCCADEPRLLDAQARVQRLERRQGNTQVRGLRLRRQFHHRDVHARGAQCVLHDAGRQPGGRIPAHDDQVANGRTRNHGAHELTACLAGAASPQ
jgi:hypothetical protein